MSNGDVSAQRNNYILPVGASFAQGTWGNNPVSEATQQAINTKGGYKEFKEPPHINFWKFYEGTPVNDWTWLVFPDPPIPDEFDVNSQYITINFNLAAVDPPYTRLKNQCKKDGSVHDLGGLTYALSGASNSDWIRIPIACGKDCYEVVGLCYYQTQNLQLSLYIGTTIVTFKAVNQRNKIGLYTITFNRLS
jgi:hypothetical protein